MVQRDDLERHDGDVALEHQQPRKLGEHLQKKVAATETTVDRDGLQPPHSELEDGCRMRSSGIPRGAQPRLLEQLQVALADRNRLLRKRERKRLSQLPA